MPKDTGRKDAAGRTGFYVTLKKRIQSDTPIDRRDTLHFLTDDAGVFYAEQIGIAARVEPDEMTRRFLVLEIMEEG